MVPQPREREATVNPIGQQIDTLLKILIVWWPIAMFTLLALVSALIHRLH